MTRGVLRLWPIPLALAGLAMLGYSAWRLIDAPDVPVGEDDEYAEVVPDDGALEGPEYFHEVAAHETDVFATFPGRVQGKGTVDIRAPQGMRVPVEKIHHEVGEYVDEGEPLITLFAERVHQAIEQAEREGKLDDKKRFESYLDHVVLRAPVDAQVFDIKTNLGEVPFDKGIPLMILIRRDAFSFVALVPEELSGISAQLGTKVSIELPDIGVVTGTINTHGHADIETGEYVNEDGVLEDWASVHEIQAAGGQMPLVIGLEPIAGLEPEMPGQLRLKTGTQEVALVPKAAVEMIDDVALVRVWDPLDSMVVDRTVKLDGTLGDDYIVVAGVNPGEHVVVRGTQPEE